MRNASAALWPAPYSAAETVRNARLSLKRSVKILVFGVIVFSLYHAHAHFCTVGQAAHLPAHVRACAAVIRARNVHHVRTRAALFKARAGVFVAVPDAARLDRRKGGLSALCRAAAVQRQPMSCATRMCSAVSGYSALSTIQTKTGASPWFETVMLPGSGESAMRFSFFR